MESMGCLRWLLMLVPMSLLTVLGLGGMVSPEPVPPTPYSPYDAAYFYITQDGTLQFPYLPDWTLTEGSPGIVSMTNSLDWERTINRQELQSGEFVITVITPQALNAFGADAAAGPYAVIEFFRNMQAPDASYGEPIYKVIGGRDAVRIDIVNLTVPIEIQFYAFAVQPDRVAVVSLQTQLGEGYLGDQLVIGLIERMTFLGDRWTGTPPPTVAPNSFTPSPTAYPPTAMGAFSIELEDVIGVGDSEAETITLGFNDNALMENWSLRFTDGTMYYVFPPMLVMSGSAIRVHSGIGVNTPTDLYAGWNAAQWQSGDMIYLYDSAGRLMDTLVVP